MYSNLTPPLERQLQTAVSIQVFLASREKESYTRELARSAFWKLGESCRYCTEHYIAILLLHSWSKPQNSLTALIIGRRYSPHFAAFHLRLTIKTLSASLGRERRGSLSTYNGSLIDMYIHQMYCMWVVTKFVFYEFRDKLRLTKSVWYFVKILLWRMFYD